MTHLTPTLSMIQGASRRHSKFDPGVITAAAVVLGLFAAVVALVLVAAPPIGPDVLLGLTS